MDTILSNTVSCLFAAGVVYIFVVLLPKVPTFFSWVRFVAWCWWVGAVRVNSRQEKMARSLAACVDDAEDLDLEAVSDLVELNGGRSERRVRRKKVAPFASFLVGTIRGELLSQCLRTESNVLVFERHARSLMAKHGVRPTDAARVLPYATALFFDHRSFDQIEAAAITQATSFVNARRAYSAEYVSVAGQSHLGGNA
jgi:hypothetical protein